MKGSRILLIGAFFVILVSQCNPQSSEAKALDPLYSELDGNGTLISGDGFISDQPVLRPEYRGNKETLINDITDANGTPFFKTFYEERPSEISRGRVYLKKEEVIYYNKVGMYNSRSLSLKLTFLIGHFYPGRYYAFLESDGSIGLSVFPDVEPGEGAVSYQLVYSDTKEVVKGVNLELPQTIFNSPAFHLVWPFTSFSLDPMKHTFLMQKKGLGADKVERFTGELSKRALLKIKPNYIFDLQVGQEYVLVSDNASPMISGVRTAIQMSNKYKFMTSNVLSPLAPTYSPPVITGKKSGTNFQTDYTVIQTLSAAFEKNYPEEIEIVIKDNSQVFNKFDRSTIDLTVRDKDNSDITQKVRYKDNADHSISLFLDKTLLSSLKNNAVSIDLIGNPNEIDISKIKEFYDETKKSVMIPLVTYNRVKTAEGELVKSEELSDSAESLITLSAETVTQNVGVGSSTNDFAISNILKNVKSSLPGDTVKILGLTQEKIFDAIGTYQLGVTLQSTLIDTLFDITYFDVVVTDELVTSPFFENQQWLIDEINRQFKNQNKVIDKNLYLSDLLKITKIMDTRSDVKFTGQHIPKTISALKNLDWLELWDKGLIGPLPSELGDLGKLQKISIFGSQLTGNIPDSLGQLTQLKQLLLQKNKLTGTLPASLSGLTALLELNVNNNQLIGGVPEFPTKQLERYDVSGNQVTYNAAVAPAFIKRLTDYGNTLIVKSHSNGGTAYTSWSLSGIKELAIEKDGTEIKPFDSNNSGYFDLKLSAGSGKQVLYATHTYRIINKKTGKTVYEGPADKELVLTVNLEEDYEVILDGADKNPNNRLEIKGKQRELKLVEVPKQLSLNLKAGDLSSQPVKIVSKDTLTLFDNRVNSQWKLRLKPSQLANATQSLIGSYYYTSKNNQTNAIPVDSFKEIEKGDSEPDSDSIPISADWTDSKGLQFKQESTANHKGTYTGKLEWQLVDAPGP